MKAIKKLVLLMLVGSVAAFNYGCGGKDDQGIPNLQVTASSHSAAPGDVVDIAITTSADGDGKITTLKIDEVTSGTSGSVHLLDSNVNQNNYGFTYKYHVPMGATGTKTIVVTVTDNLGQTNSKEESISIAGGGGSIRNCDNVTLGSYDNASQESFFGSKNCTQYFVAGAKANQSAVDMVYFYGATNFATLAAPDDADAESISTFQLGSWSTRNATRFKMITGFDYANATPTSITAAYTTATGLEMSKANNLGAGQMVAFKTADGRYGVAKINSITPGAGGTMNISVKSTL